VRPVAVIALLCAAIIVANCSPGKKQAAWQQAALERELAGEMVSIPGGEFLRMGDLDEERSAYTVTVPAFRLGKYEVTFAQWDACVADGGCNGYSPHDRHQWYHPDTDSYHEGWGRGNRPVINVSWDDAQSFIDWLNKKTGGNYRLPTEAEWQYAVRAGTTTAYSWGDDIGNNRANCDGCGSQWDNEQTAPVGSFPANPWGLHDMIGNVWEWTKNCWSDRYESVQTSGDCRWRVVRGGSWISDSREMSSTDQIWWLARSRRDATVGFRLAQDEEQQPPTTAGDPLAEMLALGRLYRQGELGLPKDYIQAYQWFDLAASQGAAALEERDALAALMTPEQIEKAQSSAAFIKLLEDMVAIPSGTFRMGDLSGVGDDDELPVRTVTVPAFKLSKYEVTFDQWDTCVMDGGCNDYSPDDEDWGRGHRPVVNVSWYDVQSFIDWLNARTGGNYRLPTEAEWEYAARAGTTTEYSGGDDIGENQANCDGCGSQWDNDQTAPVGSFPANPWGLHEMHGNVWEWVQDCWNDSYESAPTDGSAWTSGDCSRRVLRGGSWLHTAGYLRSAYRDRTDRSTRFNLIGFRLAQDEEQHLATMAGTRPAEMLALGRLYRQGGLGVTQDYTHAQKWFNLAASHSAQTGDIDTLEAAVSARADVNARAGRGRTALMHAADKGYPQLVSLLLDAQSNVNASAPDGATALFMAASHGHTEVIELLMKAGAHVSLRGAQGKTPAEAAEARYGATDTARESGAPPALLALLDGKTWAEAEAEQARKRQENETLLSKLPEDMVSIPGGTFRMGDLSGEGGENEQPVRSVTVPAFKLGKHEVTFAQWDACVADGGCNGYTAYDFGWRRGTRPVVFVSWDEAQSFIAWVNHKLGGNFRLPTEAEWEYAVRAGSITEYSWGDDIGSNRANCDGCGSQWDDDRTAPVGSFPATAWGLHDMHGNVWEWVQDCWNDSYEGAPTDGSTWMRGDCSRRVFRGGSWGADAGNLRSASRGWAIRPLRDDHIGFRLAQDE